MFNGITVITDRCPCERLMAMSAPQCQTLDVCADRQTNFKEWRSRTDPVEQSVILEYSQTPGACGRPDRVIPSDVSLGGMCDEAEHRCHDQASRRTLDTMYTTGQRQRWTH